jgi:hypothetical protein
MDTVPVLRLNHVSTWTLPKTFFYRGIRVHLAYSINSSKKRTDLILLKDWGLFLFTSAKFPLSHVGLLSIFSSKASV